MVAAAGRGRAHFVPRGRDLGAWEEGEAGHARAHAGLHGEAQSRRQLGATHYRGEPPGLQGERPHLHGVRRGRAHALRRPLAVAPAAGPTPTQPSGQLQHCGDRHPQEEEREEEEEEEEGEEEGGCDPPGAPSPVAVAHPPRWRWWWWWWPPAGSWGHTHAFDPTEAHLGGRGEHLDLER